MKTTTKAKSPARVLAGKRNRRLRRPITDAGRRRRSEAARRNRAWEKSSGPKTAAGKVAAARNGRARMNGDLSVRDGRAAIARIKAMIAQLACLRKRALAEIAEWPLATDR